MNCDSAVSDVAKQSFTALLRRLAHQSEAAPTRAQIPETETADIRREYSGKRALKPTRSKLTARVIDNLEVDRLREADAAKEEERGNGKLREKRKVQGEGEVPTVGWAGRVARRVVARCVHKADAL